MIPSSHTTDAADSGHPLAAAKREKLGWEEICKRAAKVISFIDLAGHERYFKTTLYGLSGCAPDYVMLMVGGNAGLIGMSKVCGCFMRRNAADRAGTPWRIIGIECSNSSMRDES